MADHVDFVLGQWARRRPDLDTTPMAVLGRLSRLTRLVEAQQQQTFARHELDASSFDVLATLRRCDPPHELTAGQLAAASMVTSGAVSQRLDRLEAKGLVLRRRGDVDARTVLVTLTATGMDAVDAALPDHLQTGRGLLASLTTHETEVLADALRTLLARLEDVEAPARHPA